MPLRGESIGTAYVRVLADATGFPQSLRDEIDRDEPGIRRLGRHHAQAFEEGFDEEIERGDNLSLSAVLNRALGSNEATQQFFQGKDWARFKTRMKNEFGNVGDLAAHELEEKFVNSGSLRGLDDEVERVISKISNTTKRVLRTSEAEAQAATKSMTDFESNFRRVMTEADDVSRRVANDNEAGLERVRRSFEGIASTVRKLHVEFGRSGEDAVRYVKGLKNVDRQGATTFARLAKEVDGVTDKVGRLFGKGSRNDFLNFTGSFIGGATGLLSLPLKFLDNVGQFVNGFKDATKAGEGFFQATKTGFTEMAKDAEGGATSMSTSFGVLLVSLPVLAATIGGIVLILGPVAALVSGIAAAVTALAGSLAFGLVGAIAPLIGALLPLAAAFGVVLASIKLMNKKDSKELADTMSRLKKEGGELADVFAKGFGSTFNESIDKAIHNLAGLEPLFGVVGKAVGNFANRFVAGLRSPIFNRFLIYLQRQIPNAVAKTTTAIGNIFSALTSVFIDLVPQTRDFFDWLDKITEDFKNFVQQNPDKVRKFFRDAADSTEAIGGFLGKAVDFLGKLLSKGKTTGDDIFTSLGDNIQKFSDFLDKHPDALSEFFKNGKETADEIGKIAIALGKIFDALDSKEGRKNLHDVLNVLGKIGALAGPLELVAGALNRMINPLSALGHISFSKTEKSLDHLGDKINGVVRHAISQVDHFGERINGAIRSGVSNAVGWLNRLGDKINSSVRGGVDSAVTSIDHLGDRINSAVRGAVSDVMRWFGSLPDRLGNLASRFGGAAARWASHILNEIESIPGQIVGWFTGLGARIAAAIGDIALHFSAPSLPGIPGLGTLNDLNNLRNKFTASGGIFNGAQARIIAERGAEAVVPLTGPLSAVDPSVRWLAELARGQSSQALATTMPGKTINNEWHVTTVTPNVVGVAQELLDRMATTAY